MRLIDPLQGKDLFDADGENVSLSFAILLFWPLILVIATVLVVIVTFLFMVTKKPLIFIGILVLGIVGVLVFNSDVTVRF